MLESASTSPPAVPAVARRQGGVFTADQARAEGWTGRTIRRRIAAHRWVYVAGRALAEPAERWTAFQLATAARLTYPQGVISHRTAAVLHGFPGMDRCEQVCDVTFTTSRRPGRAIRVHMLRLDPVDVEITRAGLRITTRERTALDCLATLDLTDALDLWAWVSTRRVLDRARLDAAIARRRHWYGTPQLTRLRDLVADGAVSGAEYEFHRLLREAGLTGWTANVPIRIDGELIAVADVAFLAHLLIIEIDGWRAHSSHESFVADRRRQNRLITAGYTVLRFTWDDLTHRRSEVVAQIRAALGIAGLVRPGARVKPGR